MPQPKARNLAWSIRVRSVFCAYINCHLYAIVFDIRVYTRQCAEYQSRQSLPMKPPGQIAYEAYYIHLEVQPPYPWLMMTKAHRKAWTQVASAVVAAYLKAMNDEIKTPPEEQEPPPHDPSLEQVIRRTGIPSQVHVMGEPESPGSP